MSRIPVLSFWIILLGAAGYGASVLWERTQLWNEDKRLFSKTALSPGLPTKIEANLSIKNVDDDGLRFSECKETGIDFSYDHGARGKYHLAETLGGGVGAIDYDLNGSTDLIFIDGGDPITWPENSQNRVVLYQQQEAAQFKDITTNAGIHWTGYGHGCAIGDLNNDGFDDVLVTGYQSVGLFINLGDGTFQDVTTSSGITSERWCATAAFGDLDSDGDLDLYVTAYTDTPRTLPTPFCEENGKRVHCHPHHYAGIHDLLFENLGTGMFADRSASSGIDQFSEYGLGTLIVDLDHDQVPEIFVSNDGNRNLLFQKSGEWNYEEIGMRAGVAYDSQGRTMGSMGIACADFDRNGLLDLMTTNFARERNVIFNNLGEQRFVDKSLRTPIDVTSRADVGWAAIPIDADNDGVMDLFVANGHVSDIPEQPYKQKALFHQGLDNGHWKQAASPGPYFEHPWHGRGAIAADVTGDHRPDLIVSHIADRASILRNDSIARGKQITIKLIGIESNRSAINTRLEIAAGEKLFVHQLLRSAGYLSAGPDKIHIGIGQNERAEKITIFWPSGRTQTLVGIPTGSEVILREGRSPLIQMFQPASRGVVLETTDNR